MTLAAQALAAPVAGEVDTVRREAERKLGGLRTSLESGSLATALGGTLRLTRQEPLPAPTVAPVAAPAGVPPEVAAEIGTLMGAWRHADAMVKAATRPGARLPDMGEGIPQLIAAEMALLRPPLDIGHPERAAAVLDDPAVRAFERTGRRIERDVDVEDMRAAALLLAGAVDATLPALRAYATSRGQLGVAVAGCDVVDQTPHVCIGGLGDNTYTADVALQIDLGGNDTYHNETARAVERASLVLDVAGSDRYERRLSDDSWAFGQAQAWNGAAVLVDGGGDDRYSMSGKNAVGQAYAMTAGVAVLADLAGADVYELEASDEFNPAGAGLALGQAFGIHGVALLLDRGLGDDRYVTAGGAINAIGMGFTGSGVFFDDGGSDEIVARALALAPPRDPQCSADECTVRPGAFALGFGHGGIGGTGVAMTGVGATRWSMTVDGSGPNVGWLSASGMGYGIAGFGALSDAGGDDTYNLATVATAVEERVATDDCACSLHAFASAAPEKYPGIAQPEGGAVDVYGFGFGMIGGTGTLQDLGGDDTYRAEAVATATAILRDERTSAPPGETGVAEARVSHGRMYAGGMGFAEGNGVLIDAGGADVYRARLEGHARAVATSARQDASLEARAFGPLQPTQDERSAGHYAFGIGAAGLGALIDTGGTDSYEFRTAATATADPPTAASAKLTSNREALGGGVAQGFFSDVDGAAADHFSVHPPAPTLFGERGESVWIGRSGGIGLNG